MKQSRFSRMTIHKIRVRAFAGLTACATVISLLATDATALANSNQPHPTPWNPRAGQKSHIRTVSPRSVERLHLEHNQQAQPIPAVNPSVGNQQQANNSTAQNNQQTSTAQPTENDAKSGQITILYKFHKTNIALQSKAMPIGSTVHAGDLIPPQFKNDFKAVHPYRNYKVRSKNTQVTVHVQRGKTTAIPEAKASVHVAAASSSHHAKPVNPDTPSGQDTLSYAQAFAGEAAKTGSDSTHVGPKERTLHDINEHHEHISEAAVAKAIDHYGYGYRTSSQMAPVAREDESKLPTGQYLKHQGQVTNPMLMPNGSARIKAATEFHSTVPMGSANPQDVKHIRPFKDFSNGVLRYRPYLNKVCQHYGVTEYETLLLSIMQVETGGQGNDVMQSSESLGLAPGSLDAQDSIEQGVKYFAGIVHKAQQMDKTEQDNPNLSAKALHHYAKDNRLLAQAYNYGPNFLDYISRQKTGYDLGASQRYSKNVVAPRLGNQNGTTYHYSNPISNMYHKDYLYTNGGNFYYGDMVERYASSSNYLRLMMKNLIQLASQPYSFGGNNANVSGDGAGLIADGYNSMHIYLPKTISGQWKMGQTVQGGMDNAQPGDLIFFHGIHGQKLGHVGIILDHHTMISASSKGVSFYNLDSPFWQKYFADVKRLPQSKRLNAITTRTYNQRARQAVDA